jgi:hypothetical protein
MNMLSMFSKEAAMIKKKVDFDVINARAIPYAEEIFDEIGLDGEMQGKEYVCLNPNRDEDSELGSFKINTETFAWADFAVSEAKGIGLVSFVAYVKGYSLRESAIELIKWVKNRELPNSIPIVEHTQPAPSQKSKEEVSDDSRTIVQPIPANAPRPATYFGKEFGKPAKVSPYKDVSGNTLGFILRFNLANGNKTFRELSDISWRFSLSVLRQLYRYQRLFSASW